MLQDAILIVVGKANDVGEVDLNAILMAQTDESCVIFRVVMSLVHLQKGSPVKTLGPQENMSTTGARHQLNEFSLFEHLSITLSKERQIELLVNHRLQQLWGLRILVEIVGGKNDI